MKNIAIKRKCVSFILCCFSGCTAFLDELPHDRPADVNFFGSEQELIMAVHACYRELTPHNAVRTDAISESGYSRNSARPDINALANEPRAEARRVETKCDSQCRTRGA